MSRTQQVLLESEARARIISELTSDYTYAVRVEPDGQLVAEWMAGAFERVTGYNVSNTDFSSGYPSLLHPDDVVAFLERRERLLANQPDVREYRMVTKSGETRWLRDHARPE